MNAWLARLPFLAALLLAGTAALHLAGGSSRASPDFEVLDLVVCLDVSRSMLARDGAPDRLTRAKAG